MIAWLTFGKWVMVWSVSSASAISALVVGVVNSGLSPFAQALIIALVTSVVGALGMIVASLVTAHEAQQQRQHLEAIQQTSEDIKHAVGADRRKADTNGQDDSP